MPLSSTKRTEGTPSAVAVARAIASGSMTPEATACSYQSWKRASGGSVNSQRHCDVLDRQVLVDALGAALAAEAGVLDPAEGRGGIGHDALIQPDHAGLELLGDAEGALDVGGVEVGDEPVLGVVGGGDRGVLVVEADHRGDRAEDLLLEQPRVGGHAGEHGRVVEVACAVALGPAHEHGRAAAGGVVDQL